MKIYKVVAIDPGDGYAHEHHNATNGILGSYITHYRDLHTEPAMITENGWWSGPFMRLPSKQYCYAWRIRVKPITTRAQIRRMKLEILL